MGFFLASRTAAASEEEEVGNGYIHNEKESSFALKHFMEGEDAGWQVVRQCGKTCLLT